MRSMTSPTTWIRRTKKSQELENELKRLLDQLDSFQRTVEESSDDPSTNKNLGELLEKLLSDLDTFQIKLEQADECDMLVLQGLLAELQGKMAQGGQQEANMCDEVNGKARGDTAEKHLELYKRYKAKNDITGYDSPQGLILKNVVARKKQEKRRSKLWFIGSLFGEGDERRNDPFDISDAASVEESEDCSARDALRESNAKLKETVCKLETMIVDMETAFKEEIKTYQKVIMQLQGENIELHYKLEAALAEAQRGPVELDEFTKKPLQCSSVLQSPSLALLSR